LEKNPSDPGLGSISITEEITETKVGQHPSGTKVKEVLNYFAL
jgi:hypothetical protein